MKIHEYQAKELLRKHGVVTPRGFHCVSVDGAFKDTQWKPRGVTTPYFLSSSFA